MQQTALVILSQQPIEAVMIILGDLEIPYFVLAWGISLGLSFLLGYEIARHRKRGARRHPRFPVAAYARTANQPDSSIMPVSSISLGGLRLHSRTALQIGDNLNLRLLVPDTDELLPVSGKVVWTDPERGCGLQFTNLAEEVAEKINLWTEGLTHPIG